MDVSGIAGAGKSHLLTQVKKATIALGKTIGIFSPTDASVKDLRKAGFQARTFQGFQLRPVIFPAAHVADFVFAGCRKDS